MDDQSLKDLRSDYDSLGDTPRDDIQASMYHQEINTLKLEKLSNKVTIISIILPCIIIAILTFAYLDMKEQVIDVEEAKGSQLDLLAKKQEEKLSALDVRIAKASFELEEKLTALNKEVRTLENQVAKITAAKADLKTFQAAMNKLEKRIKANAGQDKTALAAMERVNQDLQAAIRENNTRFKAGSEQISKEIQAFNKRFETRLGELSAQEEQIGQISKDLSLMDKRVKTMKQDAQKAMAYQLDQVRLTLEKRIRALESSSRISGGSKAPPIRPAIQPQADVSAPKPAPAPATQAKPGPAAQGPDEEPLTQ